MKIFNLGGLSWNSLIFKHHYHRSLILIFFSRFFAVFPLNTKYEKSRVGFAYTIIMFVLTFLMGVLTPMFVINVGFTTRQLSEKVLIVKYVVWSFNVIIIANLFQDIPTHKDLHASFLRGSQIKPNPQLSYEVNMRESMVVMILNPLVIIVFSMTARITSVKFESRYNNIQTGQYVESRILFKF